ncbi:MAG: alpha/beta hydrolase [Eubacteriales bacterium]|nr:alpha/beta hydrolase [Eubacteriales bacterium]
MAINKAMRTALRALSYPASIDVEKTYKVERVIRGLRTPLSPLYQLWDHKIERDGHEVRVRIYTPKEQTDSRLLLFFHGGGWVLENVDTYNSVCRNLAKKTGCRVASVEYGLAPEHTFPEGLEDCYAAAREVYRNPERFGVASHEITLIGDSAGGNLAAAVSLMARDRGEFQVAQQILIYPATYNDHSPASRFASVRENGDGYLLTAKRVNDYMALYAGGNPENLKNPYFAPLLAEDLSRQPRTLVITAEFDPLRDEGEAYAYALRRAGNVVAMYRMPDALHGYFSLPIRYPLVRQTFDMIDHFLNGEAASCRTINETEKR